MTELSIDEVARFQQCEAVLEKGLQTFVDVGAALLEIRDSRFYRRDFATFEDYCRERWKMNRRYANRVIEAAAIVETLGPIGPKPTTESQVRPLAGLEPEQQREAWKAATETNPSPTAEHVERIAKTFARKPAANGNGAKRARKTKIVRLVKLPMPDNESGDEEKRIRQRFAIFWGQLINDSRFNWQLENCAVVITKYLTEYVKQTKN